MSLKLINDIKAKYVVLYNKGTALKFIVPIEEIIQKLAEAKSEGRVFEKDVAIIFGPYCTMDGGLFEMAKGAVAGFINAAYLNFNEINTILINKKAELMTYKKDNNILIF